MAEWRHALRRMHRAGLLELMPQDAARPGLTAGAFAVAKDESKDRLICDRRPQNSMETMVRDPELPFIPALCRFFLPPGKVWRGSARDLKDFYYRLAVPQGR